MLVLFLEPTLSGAPSHTRMSCYNITRPARQFSPRCGSSGFVWRKAWRAHARACVSGSEEEFLECVELSDFYAPCCGPLVNVSCVVGVQLDKRGVERVDSLRKMESSGSGTPKPAVMEELFAVNIVCFGWRVHTLHA